MYENTIETSADASANADQCQAGLYDNAAPPELPTPGANFVSDFGATLTSRRHPSSRDPRLRPSHSGTPSQPAAAFRARSQSLHLLLIIWGKFDAASTPGVNVRDDFKNAKNGIATTNGVNTTAKDRQFSYDLSTPISPTDCLARYSLSGTPNQPIQPSGLVEIRARQFRNTANLLYNNKLAQRLDKLPIAKEAAASWRTVGRRSSRRRRLFLIAHPATYSLLTEKDRLHKAYIDHLTDVDNKAAFYRCHRCILQQRLREMQDAWRVADWLAGKLAEAGPTTALSRK
ncbi:hypothetical protein SprV_1002878600 [Sparganum proliferum]